MKPLKGCFQPEDHAIERKRRRLSRRDLKLERDYLQRHQAILEATLCLQRVHLIRAYRHDLEAELRSISRRLASVNRTLESPP